MTDTYTAERQKIDEILGRPARDSESLLWDNLTMRQRIMLLRGVGLSPASCGYSFGALAVSERQRIMRLLTEWVGSAQRLAGLLSSVSNQHLEAHWERVRGQDLDPRLREYWRGKATKPEQERAA